MNNWEVNVKLRLFCCDEGGGIAHKSEGGDSIAEATSLKIVSGEPKRSRNE